MTREEQMQALEKMADPPAETQQPIEAAGAMRVVGPTIATGNLLIECDGRCIATVKYTGPLSRHIAERLARIDARTTILKHLHAEMQSDEGRWHEEIQMIRDELARTGDLVDT
jgi:hypothetical protein